MPSLVLVVLLALNFLSVRAVPGPDSTAVVANQNDPQSVDLARKYASLRDIPNSQICLVNVSTTSSVISLETYGTHVYTPIRNCLRDNLRYIEALVVMRGVPLEIIDFNRKATSLAMALSVWNSTVASTGALLWKNRGAGNYTSLTDTLLPLWDDGNSTFRKYYQAHWLNPFQSKPYTSLTPTTFYPGWSARSKEVNWSPLLVTVLDAWNYQDALQLATYAVKAEEEHRTHPTKVGNHTFAFMKGHDGARSVLDYQYPFVINELHKLGYPRTVYTHKFSESWVYKSDALSSFLVGTPTFKVTGNTSTIEGNRYSNGTTFVDNLTSFGCVPENFKGPTHQTQVSVSRWIHLGIVGVHGCTSEPLNNCFPDRTLLTDFVGGSTLAESWFRRMPFLFWRNLVVGDPMAAPYAKRPLVRIKATNEKHTYHIEVDADGRVVDQMFIIVDGKRVKHTPPGVKATTVVVSKDSKKLLAVAQTKGGFKPKGWASLKL